MFKDADGQDSFLMKSLFQQECIKRGVLFVALQKFCLMHTHEQIERTLSVYDEAFRVVQRAYQTANPAAFLDGPTLEPVFRRTDY
jgi:glutamate-1-semialdehyde 2,1-aminomutase/spore coat polysaccharide biosynthesis protein SpsF